MTKNSMDIEHHFLPSLYCKLSRIAAGAHLVQHVHTYDHASHLVKGTAMVSEDGTQWIKHDAPATLLIKAGIAHEVRALTDIEWYCAHISDETDPDKIDETLIERNHDAMACCGTLDSGAVAK